LLVENLILASVGGVAGLAAGRAALAGLIQLIPDQFPRWAHFDIDARVIGFSLLSVILTVIIFLAAALQIYLTSRSAAK